MQATDSQPAQETATAPDSEPAGTRTQQSAGSPEPSAEQAAPTSLDETQQQAAGQQESSDGAGVSAQERAHEQESDQSQAVAQEQPVQSQASPTPEQDNPLRGFASPIRGACITEHHNHLPAANRAYRNNGVHEGLDFYQWASCTTIDGNTEILAAKAGVVSRADLDYVEITPADWQRFIDANWEGEAILDELRGRQVWIDHGRGITTRYAHLSQIAEGIAVGVHVEQGQVIGYPGESGQQEVYANPGTDIHLHFEIRIGDGWLGQGESPETGRLLYLQAFGLAE